MTLSCAALPATTTRVPTPRCSRRSRPPTAATRWRTATTSTPSGCGELFRGHFGDQAEVYPVFNGTGANVVGLQSMLRRWESVICVAERPHQQSTRAAHRRRSPASSCSRRLTPSGQADARASSTSTPGASATSTASQPKVVSITQTTELGTCYTVDELAAICSHAHSLGLFVHLDGARISNAAATLGLPLRAFTTDVGVDVLSFGGTKNGLMFGEAVVVLNPDAVVRRRRTCARRRCSCRRRCGSSRRRSRR